MMCKARLMRRLPARESRWRCWSPLEASSGAVAVPGGEVPAVGEAGDVTNVTEQPGRVGRADTLELLQPAAGGGDQFGQLRVGRFDLLVDDREFGDQFGGELPAGAPDDVAGADRGQQRAGLW